QYLYITHTPTTENYTLSLHDALPILLTETGHEIALLAQELMGEYVCIESAGAGGRGPRGPRGPEKWMDQIMGSLGNSIAGGTTNIQRNIIGERGLGLPRDVIGGGSK